MPIKIRFKHYDCTLQFSHYGAKPHPIAIWLDGAEGTEHAGERIAMASVNVPGLQPGEVAIKSWSENEGMEQTLLDAGVIEPKHREIPTGFVAATVHRLTPAFAKYA